MKNKKLIRRQIRYLNILFKFNFQIIFRIEKKNNKIDIFIKRLNAYSINDKNEKNQH